MSLDVQRVSDNLLGSLRSCLVEGDPLSEKRARRLKQRAVAISIALQSVALAAIVLFPLLSRGERIDMRVVTPIPPYARTGSHRPTIADRRVITDVKKPCYVCPIRPISSVVIGRPDSNTEIAQEIPRELFRLAGRRNP